MQALSPRLAWLLLPLLLSACGEDRVPVTSGNNQVGEVEGTSAVVGIAGAALLALLVWLLLRRRRNQRRR